jgi:hypothetical protein
MLCEPPEGIDRPASIQPLPLQRLCDERLPHHLWQGFRQFRGGPQNREAMVQRLRFEIVLEIVRQSLNVHSCHTGLTYMLARPMLRKRLQEASATEWEDGIASRLRAYVGEKRPGILQGVEVTFAALYLARNDEGAAEMTRDTRLAFN